MVAVSAGGISARMSVCGCTNGCDLPEIEMSGANQQIAAVEGILCAIGRKQLIDGRRDDRQR